MRTLKYTFWQDGDFFLGYLNDYPDYETQAYTKEELIENLKDLLTDRIRRHSVCEKSRGTVHRFMKRRDLIRKLESMGCVLVGYGAKHDWYANTLTQQSQPIPRHNESMKIWQSRF